MQKMRTGELLVTKKIITSEQLEWAIAEEHKTGKFIGEILVKMGWATEEQVAKSLSEQMGFAYVDLSQYRIEPGIVKSLVWDMAKKYLALPLFKGATATTVAMANPLDTQAIEEIQKAMGAHIRGVFANPTQIKSCIEEEYARASSLCSAFDTETLELSELDPLQIASTASVVSLVENLITKAVEIGASDIHLEPDGDPNFYCRFRIDGILHDMPRLPKKYEAAITSRIKIMAGMDIAERRLPQDGRIQMKAVGRDIDLRISTFPTMHGENVVLRILDRTRSLIRLEELGMPQEVLKIFEQIILRPHGIILVTGPTGSGKTTTLYAVLNKINSVEKNIITMEDPIEYEIERVRQSQVNVKAGLTFASGLRSIVRQDPDIIMIGEIRDLQTAEIAIHAALTGHLVFSTLHTNDAASSATRLVDMGIEPFLVSSSLSCIVAQRLVRVLCRECKEAYSPQAELLDKLKVNPDRDCRVTRKENGVSNGVKDASLKFYREKGCTQCRNSGYSGRLGIFEVLILNDELKGLIEKKASNQQLWDAAVKSGMKTLREDGIDKLLKGITSLSEILRVTQEA